jgi:hypothetical protein
LGYSTTNEVKEVLQITETTWDTEIANCITSADSLIDSLLKFEGFSTPLSPTPQNINDTSKHFAAWLFRKRRNPAGAQAFWEEGNRFLQAYIDAEQEPHFGRTYTVLALKTDFSGLISWLQAKGAAVEVFSRQLLEESERIMSSQLEATTPVRTGKLRASITSMLTGTGVSVFPTAEYTPYVEFGTRAHEIKPRTKQVLRFPGLASGGVLRGGIWVFAKRVMHPGFPGRFFIRKAHERSRPLVFALTQRIMDEVMQNA